MDQLERSLRLFLKGPLRQSREPRITADKLGAYVKALQDRDSAKEALEAKPSDSEAKEILRNAQEVLDRSRNELKH